MPVAEALKITTEEYRLLPEGGPRYQLIEGELYMSPSPNRFHQVIVRNVFRVLDAHLTEHPTGALYFAPLDVHLTQHDVFQPDVLYVSNERADILVDEGVRGAPDLVVEVLSPGAQQIDRDLKRKAYAAAGVEEMWIVDPSDKSVSIHRLMENAEEPVAVHHKGISFESPLFPGLLIDCAEIFRG